MTAPSWVLAGSAPRVKSVTSDWELVAAPAIDGVVVKEVRSVPTPYGHLTEVYRADWGTDSGGVDQVFTSFLNPGSVTAWHVHNHTVDRLAAVVGQVLIVLYDARDESTTHGRVQVVRTGPVRPGLVVVPPGVWHGVKNTGYEQAVLLNAVDRAYDYDGPDHLSLPPDSDHIPYDIVGAS